MKVNEKEIAVVTTFKKAIGYNKIGYQLIAKFPYMMEIFAPDGTVVFANEKFYEGYDIANPDEYIGYYNLLEDEHILDDLGMRNIIERVFKGETLTVKDFKTPLAQVRKRCARVKDTIEEVRHHNVTGFPILDEQGNVLYVVIAFQIINIYNGKNEIIKAQQYINENWLESFDLETIAKAVGLSISQFSRLFKRYTGKTPYEYYKYLKIDKIKERLCDPNMNVSSAFADCAVDYYGRYRQYFKEIVGMTPSEYWEENSNFRIVD